MNEKKIINVTVKVFSISFPCLNSLFYSQRIIIKVVTSPDQDLGLKEATVLVTMLSYLTPYLDREEEVRFFL